MNCFIIGVVSHLVPIPYNMQVCTLYITGVYDAKSDPRWGWLGLACETSELYSTVRSI